MTEQIKLSDLQPDSHNANKGTERGRALLEKSLHQYGAGRSILLDKNGRIIAGNKTAATAGEIGIEDVVIVRTKGDKLVAVLREDLDLSDDESGARMLAYADNRVGQVDLEWDAEALLADMTAGLPLEDFWFEDELKDIFADVPGYDSGAGVESDAEPQVNRAEELREKWGVTAGQLWRLPSRTPGQEHRLICGDCTDAAVVARVMKGEKAELLLNDPPYGMHLDADYTKMSGNGRKGREWETVIGDNVDFDPRSIIKMFDYCKEQFWWGADYYAERIPDKNNGSFLKTLGSNGDADYNSEFEICWSRQPHKREVIHFNWFRFFGISQQDAKARLHPTQKPLQVIEPIMDKYSIVGHVICDLFSGSGTTIIAAENLARQCRAVEISPGYVAVALQRYADAFNIAPELITEETAVNA